MIHPKITELRGSVGIDASSEKSVARLWFWLIQRNFLAEMCKLDMNQEKGGAKLQ